MYVHVSRPIVNKARCSKYCNNCRLGSEAINRVAWRPQVCIIEYGSIPYVGMTIMTKVIIMIQIRRSSIFNQALHLYQSALKELKVFGSDLLALSSERSLFHAIFIDNN